MKNFKTLISKLALFALVLGTVIACKKDDGEVPNPVNPNDGELITTVKLIITPTSNPSAEMYAAYRDLDGDGGNDPIIDTIRLDANTEYTVQLLLLDETKNPTDTISYEIEEEKDEHQFFFSNIGTYNLTTTYLDFDDNDVPLGLNIQWNTATGFTGKTNKFQVVLKHQPGVKPTTGTTGDESLGETDIEVNFPILIQ